MNGFKWGVTSAVFALFISVLLGIISGVSGLHIFLRALIFSLLFFGIGFGLRFVVNSFFPELLYVSEQPVDPAAESAEGHVSIAMDGMGEYAVPELFNNQGDPHEIGNIDDLISGAFKPGGGGSRQPAGNSQSSFQGIDFSMSGNEGMDLNKETGYNDFGGIGGDPFDDPAAKAGGFNETPEAEKQPAFQPQFTPSIGDDDSGLGGLPDLDMMAMAFSSNFSSDPDSAASPPSTGAANPIEESEPDRSQKKGNKPQALKGDFDPKTLAEGIRTVLSKD